MALTSYLTPGPFQPGSSTDRRTTYRAPGPLQPQLVTSVTYNVTGSGGLTLGGSATASLTYSVTASGGLTLGGSATANTGFSVTGSGGLTLGGSATTNTGFNVTGSGGLTLSGSGSSSAAYRINGSGGLTLGGTAPATITFSYVASGGLTLGGTATTTATSATTASLSETLGALTSSAAATTTVATTTGTLSATLGSLTLTASAIGNHISFEQSLVGELLNMGELTALVDNRIYESLLPQKLTLPAVVYHTGQEIGPIWLNGQSSIRSETVTLDLLSTSKSTTRAMMDAVESHFMLGDYRGNLGGGVYVAETILDSVNTSYVRLADGTDRAVRLATITLKMRYAQP